MGFAAESRERARPVLPLAGLVDVLFLLLIFVMSTYTIREQESQVDVGLPASDSAQAGVAEALKVIISYDGEGRVFLGQRQVALADLEGELRELAAINADQPVILRGDKAATIELQMRIIDAANAAGLEDIRLAAVQAE